MKRPKISSSKFLLGVLIIWLFILIGIKSYNFVINKMIERNKVIITEQNNALEQYKQNSEIKKRLFIENFSHNFNEVSRSKHILQVLEIFESLKDVDDSENETVILSDFKVSLSEVELKWTVSDLKILYYNSPNGKFKALIDRFTSLSFIEEMSIKRYEKNWLGYFEFSLSANVVNNEK